MASVFLIGFFLEETIIPSEPNDPQTLDETFELISELFSVFVALSIFGITWYAYNKSRDNHSLFLGTTFHITGLLILFHLLSYPFMPDFINTNSPHKADIFFLESRFLLAFLLLASVYVHKESLPGLINKYVLVLLTIAIISASLASMFFHEYSFFTAFDLNKHSTATGLFLLAISIIILVTGYLYKKRASETGQNNLNYFAYGSIIVLFSNLVYFSYELSGHFLIITGFFYFYLAMYRSSIELPYEKLAIAEEKNRKGVENKYRTLFDNANDAIITTDSQYLVTSWNRSAVKLFGWEAHEVLGKKLPSLIFPLNSGGEEIIRDILEGKYVFGIETENIRKDGSMIFVSLTTSQLLDSNHNLAGLSFIIRDITERKQVENALHASEEKFRTIFEGAAIGMAILELNSQSITTNPALERMLGCGSGELDIKLIFELTHPEDREADLKLFNEMIEEKRDSYQIEKRYIRRDGILVLGMLTVSLVRGGDNKPRFIISMVEDITERKRLEVNLRESEEKYRRIVETAKEGIWTLDTSVKTSYVNSRMAQILGYTTKEMLGRHLFDFMDAPARIEAEKCLERLKQGILETLDFRFSRKDGTNLWAIVSTNPIFNDKGEYVGALGMITDITERKLAEDELRESELFMDSIFASIQDGIDIIDKDMNIVKVNKTAEGWYKHAMPLVGKRCYEAYHNRKEQCEYCPAKESLVTGKSAYRVVPKHGPGGKEVGWLEIYSYPLKDTKTGQMKGVIEYVRDITERKLADETIRKSLKEKEVLLQEIHHRVKNNMQIVSSLLILQSENIEDKKYKDIFIDSQNRILSMALIHEKLYKSMSFAQIDFKEYVEGIVSNIFESYGLNSNIKIDNNVENVPIKIDFAIPCGLIINELVTNSLKYAFPQRRQGKIRISVSSKDTDMIQISISDDGVGIPKDMDIRNTKSLGLHLVTTLAENQLHGEIILNRERGTEFQINFKGAI